MRQEYYLAFGPFRFDGTQGRLWQGDQVLPLRPQSLALLRYLVEHPGRLVTKTELRQHVWTGTHVSDTVLRVSVHEIRQALGDVAAAPRYLETAGRQGYRFLLGKMTWRCKLLPPVSEIHSIFHIPPNWEETQCITSTLALHHP